MLHEDTMSTQKLTFSAPKDESLEAYKEWIIDTLSALHDKDMDSSLLSDEEWMQAWKEFWS